MMYAVLALEKPGVTAKVNYHVVHAIPGRVRFRVPLLANDLSYAERLQVLLELDGCVTKVRVNRHAASIIINYRDCNLPHWRLFKLIQDAWDGEGIKGKGEKLTVSQPHYGNPNLQHHDGEDGWKVPAFSTLIALMGLALPIPTTLIATTVAVAALPVAKRALMSITTQHKLNIDCLDFLAILLTSAQGNLLASALVMTLHEIGDAIRDRTARISHDNAADLLQSLGSFAWVEQGNGEKKRILATDVELGDRVIVYPGEQIPVDGKILKGKALIDQQKLTGESLPVVREAEEYVYASTLVREGTISINTERVGSSTLAGASIQLMQAAPVYDTRMVNRAAEIADKTILPALIFSGIVLATTRNPIRAASILTLDFMTGIRVSLPTSYLAAINHATRHGILFRSGRALEKLSQVDTLVFDKTGTLTQGNVAVVAVEAVSRSITAERLLELAVAAEQRLTHPVAEAVIRYAVQKKVRILPRGEWEYEIGAGVRAEIDGEEVLVGSERFLQESGISILDLDRECKYNKYAGNSYLYVAINGELKGVISYTDPLRRESAEVITKLQYEQGMEVHLLTGDSQDRAFAVAKKLGIPVEHVHAEAFPERKVEIIRTLHESRRTVGFTGDGLNDSAALAYADVSISFGNGSEVARETADVVLMDNNLESLLEAIAIAQETKAVIQQNIGLAVLPNLAALGFATTVGMHPLVATVVHNGSAIAAGLNALRPLMHQDPPRKII
jgi:P-type Cu2+ transporter